MSDLKISVIIPEYNGGNKIRKCLENLDKQTFEQFEVIIIDDCSPDSSVSIISEVIENLEHKDRFKLVESEVNGRAGKARNTGVALAQGEYIVFVDQDDYPDTLMLEQLYSCSEDSAIDCVVCDVVDKEGIIYHRPQYDSMVPYSHDLQSKFVTSCGYVFAILIRKKLIIDNHLSFPENRLFEDVLYNCGLFSCANSIRKIDKALYIRESDNDSQTASLSIKKMSDRVEATKWYLNNYSNNPNIMLFTDEITIIAFYYIYISVIWWMLRDKKLFSRSLYETSMAWAKSKRADWKCIRIDAEKRGFPLTRILMVRIVYYCPFLFPLFQNAINIIKKVKERI